MFCPVAIFVVANLALFGASYGQVESMPSADDVLKMAGEAANIPGLNASALPIEETKQAFKDQCEKNGGANAFSRAENATKEVEVCVKSLMDINQLQSEMEPAKKTGDLDTVFKKYCDKSPSFTGCIQNFTNAVEPCFTQAERENIKLARNITDSLLGFLCYKDGDRIAMFISAAGPECLSSKQNAIQDCVNTTFGSSIPTDGLPTTVNAIPVLLLDTETCEKIEKLQGCVVKELEKCSDPTTGNLADSLFNFVKKVTPCENLLSSKARADRSSDVHRGASSATSAHLVAILLGLFSLRLL